MFRSDVDFDELLMYADTRVEEYCDTRFHS